MRTDYFDPGPVLALQGDAADAEYARRLHVPRRTLLRWRNGTRLYRDTAERVAFALDRHPLDLWPDFVELDETWRHRAACRNTNGRYHLAEDISPPEVARAAADPALHLELTRRRKEVARLKRQAREICRDCPVRLDCLDWVLRNIPDSTDVGIWAATSRNQRSRMRKTISQKVA